MAQDSDLPRSPRPRAKAAKSAKTAAAKKSSRKKPAAGQSTRKAPARKAATGQTAQARSTGQPASAKSAKSAKSANSTPATPKRRPATRRSSPTSHPANRPDLSSADPHVTNLDRAGTLHDELEEFGAGEPSQAGDAPAPGHSAGPGDTGRTPPDPVDTIGDDKANRGRRIEALLRVASLKAGTLAAARSMTGRVPGAASLMPWLPVVGVMAAADGPDRVRDTLVNDVLALRDDELDDEDRRAIRHLACKVQIKPAQVHRDSIDPLIAEIGRRVPGFSFAMRMLPWPAIAAEVIAAIVTTYAAGRRADILSQLPGDRAGSINELLADLGGLDRERLTKWAVEAVKTVGPQLFGAFASGLRR